MNSNKIVLIRVFTAVFGLAMLAPATISAVNASPDPVAVVLPDNTVIMIRGVGDEWEHYAETIDGYTVLRSSGGWYYYARNDGKGGLEPSDQRARGVSGRTAMEAAFAQSVGKHLRPSIRIPNPARVAAAREVASIRALKDLPARQNATGQTVHKILVILIDFPDLISTETALSFENMMNQSGYEGGYGATGSMNDYFSEVSYGQFGVSADVYGWYRAANNFATYGDGMGDLAAPPLVREAVDAAEADVNFSLYDNDGDGTAEGIFVVHAGPGAEEGSLDQYIWSHRWVLSATNQSVSYDGVLINGYTIEPEKQNDRHAGIGVYAHEYGHDLGLPDLYDTNISNGESEGIGNWGLMGGAAWLNAGRTPAHLTPWSKIFAEWVQPTTITTNGAYSFGSVVPNGDGIYRINQPGAVGEYFLLENRQLAGFDLYLPGAGLLIWHIDSTMIANNRANNAVNGDETHKGIDLEAADGLADMDDEVNRGDTGDPFPGFTNNVTFDDTSTPSARDYAGNASDIAITNISTSATTMTADITVRGGEIATTHFTPVYTGNPYLAMNIYVTSATLEFVNLVAGDEIGIYDGNICVGTAVLTEPLIGSFRLPLIAATDDPTTTEQDGFIPGNEIYYRLWDADESLEVNYGAPTYTVGDGTFSSQGTAVVGLSGSYQPDFLQHFQVAYPASSNPYLAMNIYVSGAVVGGTSLVVGDEIGIYDGSVCVGAGRVMGPVNSVVMLGLVASTDDPTTSWVDGFIPGRTISYRFWDAAQDIEYASVVPTYTTGDGIFASHGTAVVGLAGSTTQAADPFVDIGGTMVGISASDLEWGDFDNDGDLDFIVLGYTAPYPTNYTEIYRNDAGVFTAIGAGLPQLGNGSLAWLDYDTDGDLDLLLLGVGSDGTTSAIYENNGGVFADALVTLPLVAADAIDLGDYDNDGDIDILVVGYGIGGGRTFILVNDGAGSYIETDIGLPGLVGTGTAIFGDYDIDEDLDIFIMGRSYDSNNQMISTAAVYRNDRGLFTDTGAGITAMYDGTAAWGSFRNDGFLDLLVTGTTDGVSNFTAVYKFSIDGNDVEHFTNLNLALPAISQGDAQWGDYDNDGDIDILLMGNTAITEIGLITRVYENRGDGTVSMLGVDLRGSFNCKGVWGDYDGDGDLDILQSGGTNSVELFTNIYRNTLDITNEPPAAPTNLTSSPSSATNTVFLMWQPAVDDNTISQALTYNLMIGTASGGIDVLTPHSNLVTGKRLVAEAGNAQQQNGALLIDLPEGTYYWKVQAIDGAYLGSAWSVEASFIITDLAIAQGGGMPESYMLHSAYPNPFNPQTSIEFDLPAVSQARLAIYDLRGRLVKELASGIYGAGYHRVQWNGQGFASGIYIARLITPEYTKSIKMLLLK